jgi:DNA-directed RNA polymerase specialized sigma24 family protein
MLPPDELDLQSWLGNEPSLKPIHRACLILHFAHGMTRSEIAQRLALSETKVKGHLQYALQLLRKGWKCAGTGERHGTK